MELTLEKLSQLVEQQAQQLNELQAELRLLKQNGVPEQEVQPPVAPTSRRRVLRQLAGGMLAGLAIGGAALAGDTREAQARLVSNPSNFANTGALVTRPGAVFTGTLSSVFYGLIASADSPANMQNYVIEGIDSAIVGLSTDGYGVVGNSNNGSGLRGFSQNGPGLSAYSSTGNGVFASTGNPYSAALEASAGSSTGVAFEIFRGSIKVAGAGVGSSTAAFIHLASASNVLNYITVIDNPIINTRPDALLFVTHNFNPPSTTVNYLNKNFGVYYSGSGGSGRWNIYLEDQTTSILGSSFNVLAILP